MTLFKINPNIIFWLHITRNTNIHKNDWGNLCNHRGRNLIASLESEYGFLVYFWYKLLLCPWATPIEHLASSIVKWGKWILFFFCFFFQVLYSVKMLLLPIQLWECVCVPIGLHFLSPSLLSFHTESAKSQNDEMQLLHCSAFWLMQLTKDCCIFRVHQLWFSHCALSVFNWKSCLCIEKISICISEKAFKFCYKTSLLFYYRLSGAFSVELNHMIHY